MVKNNARREDGSLKTFMFRKCRNNKTLFWRKEDVPSFSRVSLTSEHFSTEHKMTQLRKAVRIEHEETSFCNDSFNRRSRQWNSKKDLLFRAVSSSKIFERKSFSKILIRWKVQCVDLHFNFLHKQVAQKECTFFVSLPFFTLFYMPNCPWVPGIRRNSHFTTSISWSQTPS